MLVFHCVLLSSVAGMAALWTAAKMLMMIAVLQTSADESIHSTVGRPSQAPNETHTENSTTDYSGFGDVTSDEDNTNVTFVDNFGKQELMLNENIDMLVMLIQALRRDTSKDHQRLLLKLKAHGIGDSITDWIEQWLTDRRQRVVVDGEVSNWKSVLSGVPQGSVLGPILFLIYINDLDDSITSNVLKFADDTKLFRKVNTDGDKQHLQNDLDRLVKWYEKWQMLFNFGKCKCLHTGHRNLNVNYKMGDTVLGTTVKEKDLGVTISADMKVSEQCGIAASKGNQILGLIRRNITYKGKKLIIPLYKAIVRPHLEYCIQAWRPYRKKDIDTLERIQRRATKMIPELRDLSYEERLKECGLTTLETRRLRGDQIEVFKILNGYENIDINMFFSLKKDSRTRGHEVKLVKDQCRLDIRKHSFSQRTINEWNKLSTDCVTASSVNMFKNKVDTYLRRAGYK